MDDAVPWSAANIIHDGLPRKTVVSEIENALDRLRKSPLSEQVDRRALECCHVHIADELDVMAAKNHSVRLGLGRVTGRRSARDAVSMDGSGMKIARPHPEGRVENENAVRRTLRGEQACPQRLGHRHVLRHSDTPRQTREVLTLCEALSEPREVESDWRVGMGVLHPPIEEPLDGLVNGAVIPVDN